MIKRFFETISQRLYNENSLSDITWAMCYSSTKFMETFLKFFFPEIQITQDISIEREVSSDNSRPDFVIHNGSELYIIENKIYDNKQHFGQYDKSFEVEPEHFGYIANYKIDQQGKDNYQIRTWEDFYYYLASIKLEDENEQTLIEGYREYIKDVCNIIEFTKPMNIEGIYSLYQLMEIMKKLCYREESNFSIHIINQDRTYQNGYADHYAMGMNFEITFKTHELTARGWMGIYFNEELPIIYIAFWDYNNWGKPVCEILHKHEQDFKEGSFSSEPYYEDDAYWFQFIDGHDTYEDAFNKLSLKEQTGQLKSFMDEVFNSICSHIE